MHADLELIELVSAVIPKPKGMARWKVQIVNSFHEVDADAQTETVRVHKLWRETIYNAGLHHVTRHYPLGLVPAKNIHEPPAHIDIHPVNIWRAVAIERDYWYGRLTGELSVGEAYIAQTFDKLGLFADEDLSIAIHGALSERRAKRRKEQKEKLRLAKLRRQLRSRCSNVAICTVAGVQFRFSFVTGSCLRRGRGFLTLSKKHMVLGSRHSRYLRRHAPMQF